MRSMLLASLLVLGSTVAAMAEGGTPASIAVLSPASSVIAPQVIHNNGIKLPDTVVLGQLTDAQKTVVLSVEVDPHGSVRAVHILKSAEPVLDKSVLEAVHELRFSPARLDDHPIPLQIRLIVKLVS